MFTRKSLSSTPRRRSYFFKYMTMFFLGASAVLLATTQAFQISTSLTNAVQYIQHIILTVDGSNLTSTKIDLDGSNGDAYFMGKIGIGTNSPTAKLTISGSILLTGADGRGLFRGTAGSNVPYIGYLANLFIIAGGAGNSGHPIALMPDLTNSTKGILITTGGNVGIGTSNPNAALEVSGNIYAIGQIYNDSSIHAGSHITAGGNIYSDANISAVGNVTASAVGIGIDTPSEALEISGGNMLVNGGKIEIITTNHLVARADSGNSLFGGHQSVNGMDWGMGVLQSLGLGNQLSLYTLEAFPIALYTSGTQRLTVTAGGNVGIGTSSPSEKLEVAGGVKVANTSSYYYGQYYIYQYNTFSYTVPVGIPPCSCDTSSTDEECNVDPYILYTGSLGCYDHRYDDGGDGDIYDLYIDPGNPGGTNIKTSACTNVGTITYSGGNFYGCRTLPSLGYNYRVKLNIFDSKFAITSLGRVGIGTATPSAPLDVNGTGKIDTIDSYSIFRMVLPEALSTACTSVGQSHYLGDSYEGTTLSSVARRDVVYLVSDDSPTGTNNFYMSYVDNAGNHVAQVGYTGEPEHGNTIYLPKGYAIRVQCMDSGTNIKFHYLRMRSHDF